MPASLKHELEREAKSNGRSLTAELVARLETTFWLDEEISTRTDGGMDHSSIMGWVANVERLNLELQEKLGNRRELPIELDEAAFAQQMTTPASDPDTQSLIAFLALQAAYPTLITDDHRERVAITAARVGGLPDTQPDEILASLMSRMLARSHE